MRSRQTLIELFSTFLQLEDDRATGWATDARLRRNMEHCLESIPESTTSENFWATYWHKRWHEEAGGRKRDGGDREEIQNSNPLPSRPSPPLPLSHLSAYLQETCYWCAHKIVSRLEEGQYQLSDCFQVAIAAVPKILKAFDSDQLPSLKTYANTAFGNIIRDELRQRREVDRCNDWGLLLKLSRKQLTEALQAAGLLPTEVDTHLLAWHCFTDTYIPKKSPGLRQLMAPDAATWNAIAQRFKQDRSTLNTPNSEASPQQIERWVIACASRARSYLYPAITSLNAPRLGQESGEIQDDLPHSTNHSLLTELIAAEESQARQMQQTQVETVLKDALATLEPTLQELLQLYYQQGLTQQQIAQHLNLQQYTVSRKLAKAREKLLLGLTRWSQATLHIAPTSTVVKYISIALEEWLQAHYQADSDSRAG